MVQATKTGSSLMPRPHQARTRRRVWCYKPESLGLQKTL